MLQLWKGQIIKQEFVDLDICCLSRNLCLIFGYPVLSCLPLFYLILSYLIVSSRITSHCKSAHLSTYGLSTYSTDWATMKWQMFYVYHHIEISKILWENCSRLYFSVESMEAQGRCNILTLSKLASGRESHVTQKLFFSMTFPSDSASYLKQLN